MLAVLGFLFTTGIVVVIHEYGHYIFARLFNVKVITFSIGFGPKLLKWQGRYNEWRLSIIPLGGYVKMLDEREAPAAPELKAYAYNNKPAYQKLLIAFAGPLFNILFALIVYYFMGLYGVYNLRPIIASTNPTPLVQNLQQIQPNSIIETINDQHPNSWHQAEEIFTNTIKYTANVALKLKESNNSIILQLNLHKFLANRDEPNLIDLGLYPFRYLPIIAYVEPQSPAAQAGLKEHDQIIQINHQHIDNWFQIAQIIKNSPSERLIFIISRARTLPEQSLKNKHPNASYYRLSMTLVPDSVTDDNGQIIGKVGIMPTLDNQLIQQYSFIKKYGLLDSFGYAYSSCINLVITNLTMLKLMLNGQYHGIIWVVQWQLPKPLKPLFTKE